MRFAVTATTEVGSATHVYTDDDGTEPWWELLTRLAEMPALAGAEWTVRPIPDGAEPREVLRDA